MHEKYFVFKLVKVLYDKMIHNTLYNKGEISTKKNYFTCLIHKPTQQLIIHNCDTRMNEFS